MTLADNLDDVLVEFEEMIKMYANARANNSSKTPDSKHAPLMSMFKGLVAGQSVNVDSLYNGYLADAYMDMAEEIIAKYEKELNIN